MTDFTAEVALITNKTITEKLSCRFHQLPEPLLHFYLWRFFILSQTIYPFILLFAFYRTTTLVVLNSLAYSTNSFLWVRGPVIGEGTGLWQLEICITEIANVSGMAVFLISWNVDVIPLKNNFLVVGTSFQGFALIFVFLDFVPTHPA